MLNGLTLGAYQMPNMSSPKQKTIVPGFVKNQPAKDVFFGSSHDAAISEATKALDVYAARLESNLRAHGGRLGADLERTVQTMRSDWFTQVQKNRDDMREVGVPTSTRHSAHKAMEKIVNEVMETVDTIKANQKDVVLAQKVQVLVTEMEEELATAKKILRETDYSRPSDIFVLRQNREAHLDSAYDDKRDELSSFMNLLRENIKKHDDTIQKRIDAKLELIKQVFNTRDSARHTLDLHEGEMSRANIEAAYERIHERIKTELEGDAEALEKIKAAHEQLKDETILP